MGFGIPRRLPHRGVGGMHLLKPTLGGSADSVSSYFIDL